MSIIKYDPFRDLRSLQDEMNRLFSPNVWRNPGEEAFIKTAWSPSVDIFETADSLVLEAELPGMKPEEVDVTIENNTITIKGERKFEKKEENDNYHRVERSDGSFTRSFTLPRNVVGDEAKAEFTNGVLHIALPKREEEKARKIEIKPADTQAIAEEVKTAKA
jgi:HSP20 family protein